MKYMRDSSTCVIQIIRVPPFFPGRYYSLFSSAASMEMVASPGCQLCLLYGVDSGIYSYTGIYDRNRLFRGYLYRAIKGDKVQVVPCVQHRSESRGTRNHCFFANYGHVNTRGANEYSMILGKRLLDSLESRPGTGKP
jgi:hypothetical protein